ncbi:unnamed protein product [Protopolystoma xenopodis]|uniref:Uncharacterized protein n=1 Tax=Protopolystoma xenopodis TaxID=117903 RepID=A0A3S5AER3_9PLAT|nr:unnamed protein product [Protopolystoma xenopodis]
MHTQEGTSAQKAQSSLAPPASMVTVTKRILTHVYPETIWPPSTRCANTALPSDKYGQIGATNKPLSAHLHTYALPSRRCRIDYSRQDPYGRVQGRQTKFARASFKELEGEKQIRVEEIPQPKQLDVSAGFINIGDARTLAGIHLRVLLDMLRKTDRACELDYSPDLIGPQKRLSRETNMHQSLG